MEENLLKVLIERKFAGKGELSESGAD